MKYLKLFETFSGKIGDFNVISQDEIKKLFLDECEKENPDFKLIRTILENGLVDVNAKDDIGWTGLHCACMNFSSLDLVKLLIEAGADVNAQTNEGDVPLLVAINHNSNRISKFLIKAGADVNIKNNYGNSPSDYM